MSKKPAHNRQLANAEPKDRHLPWFTFGRRETFQEVIQKWREQKCRALYLPLQPKFRFLVLINQAADWAQGLRLAEEFLGQSYAHWEVWFLVSKKTPDLTHPLKSLSDDRLKILRQDKNLGVPLDAGLGADYVGWLDVSTTLSPVGLFLLAESACVADSAALIYWNAVSISSDGQALRQRVKRPQFSPYTMAHGNYLGQDWVVKASQLVGSPAKAVFAEPAKFLTAFAKEASDWRLQTAVLSYHRKALFSEVAVVTPAVASGHVTPPLTVIICFKDKAEWTARAIKDFDRAAGQLDVAYLLIDNGSQKNERDSLERALGFMASKLRYVDFTRPFNFAAMHNWAIRDLVTTENVFLLNNDVFWGEGSVEAILLLLAETDVATVGIALKYPSGKFQHLGFKARLGAPPHQIRVTPIQQPSVLSFWNREVFANTFAACFLKRSLFLQLGGLSELEMANGFGDVAFSLEAVRQGYRNLFYATAWATHLESGTRGIRYEYWEEACLMRKYPEQMRRMEAEDFSIEEFGGGDWLAPLLGSVKETLRRKGGQWDLLRATLKAVSTARLFGRQAEKLTP